jgi:hypothetical protein
MDTSGVLQSLKQSIGHAELLCQPLSFVYLQTCFPEDFYNEMLRQLPPRALYREFAHPDALRPDGSSTRRVIPLSEEIPNALAPGAAKFWANVVDVVESNALRDSLFRKLGTGLRDRLGFDCTATVGHRRPQVGFPRCWLICDEPGFRIGIHPDVITKLVTLQFYLPTEDTH